MKLDVNLVFEKAYLVPKLCCSLLSMSQLIDDTQCSVNFTNHFCVIQDQHSGNLIGASEGKGGLYHFQGHGTINARKRLHVDEFELWHQRLGHLADRITN